jgi:hypothetical protein
MRKRQSTRDPLYIRAALDAASRPPEKQLAFVLQFLGKSVDAMTHDERTVWSSRLRMLTFGPLASESGRLRLRFHGGPPPRAASEETLKIVQTTIRRGLKAVLAPGSDGTWPLPDLRGGAMIRDADTGIYLWQWHPDGEEWPMILGTARLVAEHGERVRVCKRCGAWFVAVKRQEFCTPEHAQQARDEKKKAKRKKGGSA